MALHVHTNTQLTQFLVDRIVNYSEKVAMFGTHVSWYLVHNPRHYCCAS